MIPFDTAENWAYVDALTARWFPPPQGPAAPADLSTVEARLAAVVPGALSPALVELATRAARDDVWNVQDRLLPSDRWAFWKDRLVIGEEAQGVTQWGIDLQHLTDPDPPVEYVDLDTDEWEDEFGRVSEFAIVWVLLAVKFSPADLRRSNGQVEDDPLNRFRAAHQPLPVGATWPADPTMFYPLDDALLEVDGDTWAWLTARDDAAFDAATERLAGFGITLDPF